MELLEYSGHLVERSSKQHSRAFDHVPTIILTVILAVCACSCCKAAMFVLGKIIAPIGEGENANITVYHDIIMI